MDRFPAYAALAGRDRLTGAGLPVARATAVLHRLAYTKQRLAITAAVFLPSTPEWEVKCALALHGWLDAEHAALLYARLAEMREPPPTPADVPDAKLEAALDEVLAPADTSHRIAALYGGVRPLLRKAVQRYLDDTNPLCDQPSVRLLTIISTEEAAVRAWSDAVKVDDEAARWSDHVSGSLGAAGGIDGTAPVSPAPTPRFRRPYSFDIVPRRDRRFRNLFDTSTPAGERNAALMFKRVREMDVPEVIAGIVAERWAEARNTAGREDSWAYYVSMLRQMWDEARHAMLGQALLESRGIDWTALPVNVTFSWKLAQFCSPLERHILLYAIEQSLMPRDRGKPYEHRIAEESGDRLSALFHDYDWADEVLHVAIARQCLRPELPGGLAEARTRAGNLWTRIARALEEHPFPRDTAPSDVADWWPRYARAVLGRDVDPVPETDVRDWRPLD
jgi:hypothetical protein